MAAAAERESFKDQLLGRLLPPRGGAFSGAGPVAERAAILLAGRGAFSGAGPVAERASSLRAGRPSYGDPAEKGLAFTVAEATRRLADLVSGAFRPSTMGALVDYLKTKLVRLELSAQSGQPSRAYVLRDEISNRSVPAAAVSPAFSPRALNSLAGKDLAASVVPAPSPALVAYKDSLRNNYRGRAPDQDYSRLLVGLPAALSKKIALVWTVADGVAYVGRSGSNPLKPLECLASPAATREMLFADHAEGRALAARGAAPGPGGKAREMPVQDRLALRERVAAETAAFLAMPESEQVGFLAKHYAFDPDLTVRTLVVSRDEFLVAAADIHPRLAAGPVAAANGRTYAKDRSAYNDRQVASRKREADDLPDRGNVVNLDERRAQARPSEGFGGARPEPGAPSNGLPYVVVADPDRPGTLQVCTYSRDGNHVESPRFASLHEMPPGEYRLIVPGHSTLEMPAGYVVIGKDMGVTYKDAARREHSEDGPSHVPEPNNRSDHARWALEGRPMPRAEWEEACAPPEAQGDAGSGFGYGAAR